MSEQEQAQPTNPASPSIISTPFPKGPAKKALENKLLTRLTKGELIAKNIITSDTAPNLHHSAKAFERKRTSDALASKLKNRPTADDLMNANIIKAPITVAPSLHEAQQSLIKKKTEDILGQHLQHRPTKDTLVSQHIMEVSSTSLSSSSTTATSESKDGESRN
eukprot:TRINITY_DN1313_c0_g1_i3.p1 TRINITY_DN1313_c0_g1~~TRINITY_DN1313_c0_g1_i3.p1  ORF type:complete len:164 (+),score=58.80 TRINITY_DN1313_c0_g1_i3:139-630(+)